MKDFLVQFIPGQKALAMALVPLMVWADHYFRLGISDVKVAAAAGVVSSYIVAHFWKGGNNA